MHAAQFDTKLDNKLDHQERKFERSLGKLETRVQGNIRDSLDRLRLKIHNDHLQDEQGNGKGKK